MSKETLYSVEIAGSQGNNCQVKHFFVIKLLVIRKRVQFVIDKMYNVKFDLDLLKFDRFERDVFNKKIKNYNAL